MRLQVQGNKSIVTVDFGEWLCDFIKLKIISSINNYKLRVWDDYLTTSTTINRLYSRTYRATEIITFAANNLVCTGIEGNISISFDGTKFVPGFDRFKLSSAVKLLDYGALDIKGCPIFREAFDYFDENIDLYAKLYSKI